MARREQKDFWKVVNIAEDGEITVLDYVFEHKDGMRGATGSKFYPVTEDVIQDRIGELEGDDIETLAYFRENFGELTPEQIRGVDSSRDALIELFFDQSYSELYDYLREVIGKSEDEVPFFDCVGGGRCFEADFKGNINPELSEIIREYESK